MHEQEKYSKIAEKKEILKEISILEREYKEIEEYFIIKMQKFEKDLTLCKNMETELKELIDKEQKHNEINRIDKGKLSDLEDDIYLKINEFKF